VTTLDAGSGALDVRGAGTFNANGSGRTVIAGGLSLGNGNRTFTVNDGLAAADLTIDGPSLTVGGSIGGVFLLTKSGTGTLTLGGSGSNTFSGLTINQGNVLLAKAGSATAVGRVGQMWNGRMASLAGLLTASKYSRSSCQRAYSLPRAT
jgi:autotransporter-associated beta strand protein